MLNQIVQRQQMRDLVTILENEFGIILPTHKKSLASLKNKAQQTISEMHQNLPFNKYYGDENYRKQLLIAGAVDQMMNETQKLQGNTNMKTLKQSDSISKLLESELQKAELVLAGKGIVDRLQKMIEQTANMQIEELLPIVERVKAEFGIDFAKTFYDAVNGQLQTALDTLKTVKDQTDNQVLTLTGDVDAADMANDAGQALTGIEGDDGEDMPAETEEFNADDTKTGPENEPLGRKRNPKFASETVKKDTDVLTESKIIGLKMPGHYLINKENYVIFGPSTFQRCKEEMHDYEDKKNIDIIIFDGEDIYSVGKMSGDRYGKITEGCDDYTAQRILKQLFRQLSGEDLVEMLRVIGFDIHSEEEAEELKDDDVIHAIMNANRGAITDLKQALGIMESTSKLGTGTKFKNLEKSLEKKGIKDPEALAASIGRKKYGNKKMAELSKKGKLHESYSAEDRLVDILGDKVHDFLDKCKANEKCHNVSIEDAITQIVEKNKKAIEDRKLAVEDIKEKLHHKLIGKVDEASINMSKIVDQLLNKCVALVKAKQANSLFDAANIVCKKYDTQIRKMVSPDLLRNELVRACERHVRKNPVVEAMPNMAPRPVYPSVGMQTKKPVNPMVMAAQKKTAVNTVHRLMGQGMAKDQAVAKVHKTNLCPFDTADELGAAVNESAISIQIEGKNGKNIIKEFISLDEAKKFCFDRKFMIKTIKRIKK